MIELSSIIVLGILAQWISWRLKLPAILPLILVGLFVGPVYDFIQGDAAGKLIEPVYEYLKGPDGNVLLDENGEPVSNKGLVPSNILFYFVSLSIGVILFEGGLTLRRKEIQGVGPAIIKLISIGSLVTFIGAGFAAWLILGINPEIAFLFSGLIIVTGPTVIAPILQNVPLTRNVSTVLKWEGILIDPIGALVAVLVFEFIMSGQSSGAFTLRALKEFVQVVSIGFALGTGAAFMLYQLIKRDLIPHYLLNVFVLALVLGVFAASDWIIHESGLLTVVVMGMVVGNMQMPHLKDILSFKESLTVLLISILFILLSANIDVEQLVQVMKAPYLLLFAVVVFLLRPLGVLLSTFNSGLNFREKLFISWVGPRGIVAAGVASLFGLKLVEKGVVDAELITPMVFIIVLGTVLLNATTARLIARLLGVTLDASNGILIVGANEGARLIGKFLHDNGRHVVLVDRNNSFVDAATNMGLEAISEDIFSDDLEERYDLLDIGYLMALTGSAEVNSYATRKYQTNFGENGTFRLISHEEMRNDASSLNEEMLFSPCTDYLNFIEVARDYPEIREVPIQNNKQVDGLCDIMSRHTIPLFVRKSDGSLHILRAKKTEMEIAEGDSLVYMGKEISAEQLSSTLTVEEAEKVVESEEEKA